MDVLDQREVELQAVVVRLGRKILILGTVIRLLLVLVRTFALRLEWKRLAEDEAKAALLLAIERARKVLPLPGVLRVLRLSRTRFHAWKRDAAACRLADGTLCPRRAPNRLTTEEVATIKGMATSLEYRHVPSSRLAVLAQRLGKVFASASTWARLIRERKWRRPRRRLHPEKPRIGLRTTAPNEAWHIDTTVVRLLNGTKAYVHAVIDNFSRRILAFRVSGRFEVASTVAVLNEAARRAGSAVGGVDTPTLVVDGGVENFNGGVDAIVEAGVLRRVLAQVELSFSNSMIEAFWRRLKHEWLFLNSLDTVAALQRHVSFYVAAHNSEIPHSAFRGQTPDEVYFGTGGQVPEQLETARSNARAERLAANRSAVCSACPGSRPLAVA